MTRRRQKKYSAELKLEAVQAYLAGEGNLRTICNKYGIKENRKLMDDAVL